MLHKPEYIILKMQSPSSFLMDSDPISFVLGPKILILKNSASPQTVPYSSDAGCPMITHWEAWREH